MSYDELIAKGWRPIKSAPKDGTKIVGLASEYPDEPEVVAWSFGTWGYASNEYFLDADLWRPIGTPGFDLHVHLQRQREFSERTFGPGPRTAGLIDHIRKELLEIEADPGDLAEWIDVAILALDGAWRTGASPQQIIDALVAKQVKNEGRTWPDWRTAPPDKAIEHDRSGEVGRG